MAVIVRFAKFFSRDSCTGSNNIAIIILHSLGPSRKRVNDETLNWECFTSHVAMPLVFVENEFCLLRIRIWVLEALS